MLVLENSDTIINRKLEHIIYALEHEKYLPSNYSTLLDEVYLVHIALPDIDFDEIDTSVTFLGHKLSAPIVIEGMTGGFSLAKKINSIIAKIAQEFGIGMGVGSQRVAIEQPETIDSYSIVRKVAPDIFLIGNIGAPQIANDYDIEDIKQILDMIDADALAIHLNPLQECIQWEGEPKFKKVKEKIKFIASQLEKPLIVKEVGNGISKEVALELEKIGVKAIDVAGLGGTSFSLIEALRAKNKGDIDLFKIGINFLTWGIPTAISVIEVRSVTSLPIIASGGIRSGIDAAKAIALGANVVGIGLPILREAFLRGEEGVRRYLRKFIKELKIAMFLTNSKTIDDLMKKPVVLSERIINWLKQRKINYQYLYKR